MASQRGGHFRVRRLTQRKPSTRIQNGVDVRIFGTQPWTSNTQGTSAYGGVAYGNGYWVEVGSSGALRYRANDPTGAWTSNTQGASTFTDVIYANGYWVAVGDNGTVYYRANDPTGAWTSNTQGSAFLEGVSYADGTWVAVGSSGEIRYATDPTGAWTLNTQGSGFASVAYGNGTWVVVGDNGALRYTSDPTGSWTSNPQGSLLLNSVTYSDGTWVAVGSEGTIWTASSPSGTWTQVYRGSVSLRNVWYANGYTVVVGNAGSIWYSTNPAAGEWIENGQGTANFDDVSYGDGYWVAIGNNGATWYRGGNPAGIPFDAVIQLAPAVPPPLVPDRNITALGVWRPAKRIAPQRKPTRITANGPTEVQGSFTADADITLPRQTPKTNITALGVWRPAKRIRPEPQRRLHPSVTSSAGAVTIEGSFTADAIVKREVSATFTADAIIFRTTSASFTADAIILRTVTVGGGATTVAFREKAENSDTGSATATGNRPTGTTDGDVLIASVMVTGSGTTVTNVPSGWTLVEDDPAPADFSIWTYWKTASSEPASWDWTLSVSETWRVDVLAYSGADGIDASHAVANAASNTVTVDLTTTVADTLMVYIAAVDASGAARTWTFDGSSTERIESSLQTVLHLGAADEPGAVAGFYSRNATVSGSAQDMAGHRVAIKPGTGGGGLTVDAVISLVTDKPYRRSQTPPARRSPLIQKRPKFPLIAEERSASFTADAVVLRTESASFTADAVIRREVSATFTADADISARVITPRPNVTRWGWRPAKRIAPQARRVVRTPSTETFSFTADAIVLRTETFTFTADAVIRREQSASFTADAVVKREVSASFTADAFIVGALTGRRTQVQPARRAVRPQAQRKLNPTNFTVEFSATFTADAVVRRESSATFTADAVVTARATPRPNITSLGIWRPAERIRPERQRRLHATQFAVEFSASFTADAIVRREETRTFTADAVVKREETRTFTADAVVLRTQTATFTADAVVSLTFTFSFTADAIVSARPWSRTPNVTATGVWTPRGRLLPPQRSKPLTPSLLAVTFSASFTADAVVLRTETRTLTADAIVKATYAASFTADAIVRREETRTFTADAIVKRTYEASLTADAVIFRTQTFTFTADAVILQTRSASITADAVVLRTITSGYSADAVILATRTVTFTADAVVKATYTATFTADAVIVRGFTGSFSADAIVRRTETRTLTADAVLLRTYAASFTADAFIAIEGQQTFSADAVIKRTESASFTLDAVINEVGRAVWVSPANFSDHTSTPVLVFTMPVARGSMHFQIDLDRVSTFDTAEKRTYLSYQDQTNWEYWNGSAWTPVPQGGVSSSFSGNQARLTISTPLAVGPWYRRVRAGVI